MKKRILIGIASLCILSIVSYVLMNLNRNKQTLEKAIVFLTTKGYKSIQSDGFGTLSLYYYNVSQFDESVFSNTVSLIDNTRGTISNLSYSITDLEVENDIQLKRIDIILNLEMYNQFTIHQIKLGGTAELVFEVGELELEKYTFASESTPQGYQITVSSFSDLVQSPSYQKYNISIRNNSNQSIQIERFKAGSSLNVNQLLDIGNVINLNIDCTSYFDADYVLVNGVITYSYHDQEYGLHLESMSFFRTLSGSDLIKYITERMT